MVGEVPQQVMVKELGAIVTIESLEFKGQVGFYIFDLFHDTSGTVVPCGPTFSPSGVDIGESEAPDKVTSQRVSAVSNGIGLDEAGLSNVPVVSADRNLIAQQAAWFGPTESFGARFGPCLSQETINGCRAD